MTCLSTPAAGGDIDAQAFPIRSLALRHWGSFKRRILDWPSRRGAARLDEPSLRDLGLERDQVERRNPRDAAALWLNRPGL